MMEICHCCTQVMADVVEALTGAWYEAGGVFLSSAVPVVATCHCSCNISPAACQTVVLF